MYLVCKIYWEYDDVYYEAKPSYEKIDKVFKDYEKAFYHWMECELDFLRENDIFSYMNNSDIVKEKILKSFPEIKIEKNNLIIEDYMSEMRLSELLILLGVHFYEIVRTENES